MPCLPSLQPGQCRRLIRGVRHHDRAASSSEPPSRAAPSSLFAPALAREGATRGASPSILRKCGGHGASPKPAASSSSASSSSCSSDPALASISACGSPISANRSGNRQHSEIRRIAIRHLVPVERRRDPRIRQRPHRIRRARRPILRILVVVQEHAVPFLLPPLRARDRRSPPLHRPRERQRRPPHLCERPPRLDPYIHVHPPRAARLRPAAQPHLVQQRLHLPRHTARTSRQLTPGPGSRSIRNSSGCSRSSDRTAMRMQLDAAQVDNPRQPRRIVHYHLFRRAPGRK